MIKLFVADTTVFADEEIYKFWYDRMDPERKKRIDAFKVTSGKYQCLCAGMLLMVSLKQEGISNYRIRTGQGGKPYIEGGEVFFNISHSEERAVIALSDEEVGVDIEKIRHFKDGLSDYVFDEREKSYRDQEPEDEICTQMWTCKESIMKYVGKGITLAPSDIHLKRSDREGFDFEAENGGYNLIPFKGIEGYMLTVCSGQDRIDEIKNVLPDAKNVRFFTER